MKKIIFLLLFIIFGINSFSNYNEKILNKEIIPRMKYSVDFEIPIINGEFPNEELMQKIAYNEKIKNPGYENYFIHFFLPGMELGSGAFATANNTNNSNPNMKTNILYYMLINNPEYSDRLKEDSNGNFYLENYSNEKYESKMKNEKIDTLDNIGAKILLDHYIEHGKLKVLGYTNLPEGMDISVELFDENYNFSISEWVVIKEDGSFETDFLSDNGKKLKKGNYEISIVSSIPSIQSENVKNIIGKKGEKLKSDITEESYGELSIDFTKKIKIK